MSMFKKAERTKVKLRMAITGAAGSGKTLGALLIAKGLGGKIAILDTENETSALYSDQIDFDVCPMLPPYSIEKYISVIEGAEKAGYDTLIIDSLTHAWAGEGGLLEQVEKITEASKSKNSYIAWGKATPLQNKLVSKIMNSKINIIATMRSKVAYEMVTNNGRSTPTKMGMAPIQREGMDYEFNLVLDLSGEGNLATVTKKRGSLFEMGQIFKITEKTGEHIKQWMSEGVEIITPKKEFTDVKPYITLLLEATSMNALATLFKSSTIAFKGNDEALEEIIKAKDIRKKQLEDKDQDKQIEKSQTKQEEPKLTADQQNILDVMEKSMSTESIDSLYSSAVAKAHKDNDNYFLEQLSLARDIRKGELKNEKV